ncbi:MAG: hypothetical protein EPN20_01060 [Magnetospirillum sp.]|nr:MAG: hypothetical protein EPN20_01060 [Magnetospirillum sp.]
MTMPRLTNLEAFTTGHPEVDGDHANLAAIIDAIKDAMDGPGDPDACKKLLESFIDTARQHFIREERILDAIGFPGLERHRLYHGKLLAQATQVKRNCDEMVEPQQLHDCFDEMARFFIDDVIRGDMEFVSFMQERRIKPPLRPSMTR